MGRYKLDESSHRACLFVNAPCQGGVACSLRAQWQTKDISLPLRVIRHAHGQVHC